jgi:hypothetical protein
MTINRMKQAKRFPVPEKLLHLPYNFELQIDSLMHAAYQSDMEEEKASLNAPCNSQESMEEIDFNSSCGSD